jgi:hypothetical protein
MFTVAQAKFEQAIAANPDSKETIIAYSAILLEQVFRNAPKIDWKLLPVAIERLKDANASLKIYQLLKKLEVDNSGRAPYADVRIDGLAAIFSIKRGMADVLQCTDELNLSNAVGFTISLLPTNERLPIHMNIVDQLVEFGTVLRKLNLSDVEPHINDSVMNKLLPACTSLIELQLEGQDITDDTIQKISTYTTKLVKLDISTLPKVPTNY